MRRPTLLHTKSSEVAQSPRQPRLKPKEGSNFAAQVQKASEQSAYVLSFVMTPKGADPSEKGSELAHRQRDNEAVPVQEMGALIVSLCSWPGIHEVLAYSEAKSDGASDPAAVGRYVGDPNGYYFDVAKGRQANGEELYDVAGARVFIWRGDREDPSVNVVIAADAGTSAERAFHGSVAPFIECSPYGWEIEGAVLNRSDQNQ